MARVSNRWTIYGPSGHVVAACTMISLDSVYYGDLEGVAKGQAAFNLLFFAILILPQMLAQEKLASRLHWEMSIRHVS